MNCRGKLCNEEEKCVKIGGIDLHPVGKRQDAIGDDFVFEGGKKRRKSRKRKKRRKRKKTCRKSKW